MCKSYLFIYQHSVDASRCTGVYQGYSGLVCSFFSSEPSGVFLSWEFSSILWSIVIFCDFNPNKYQNIGWLFIKINVVLCPWYHLGSYLYSSFCSSHLESKHAHHLNRSSRATVWQKTHSTSLKKILTDMSYKIGRYDDDLIRKHNFPAVACEKSLNTFVRSRDIVSSRPPPPPPRTKPWRATLWSGKIPFIPVLIPFLTSGKISELWNNT